MRKIEAYRFRDGVTPLSADELNRRFFDLDARLAEIEALRISFKEAISQLMVVVAERTALLIPPLISAYQSDLAFLDAESARLRAEAAALILAMGADRAEQQTALTAWLASADTALDTLMGQLGSAVTFPHQLRAGAPAAITYDGNGNLSQIEITVPAGVYVEHATYRTDGAVETLAATLAGAPIWTRTYAYGSDGTLTGWTET